MSTWHILQHNHAVKQKSYRQDIIPLYFCEVPEPHQKHTDLLSESLKDKVGLALENHLEKYSPQPLPVICSLEMVLWKLAVVGTMDPVFFLLLQSLLLLCTSSHSLGILSHMVLLKKGNLVYMSFCMQLSNKLNSRLFTYSSSHAIMLTEMCSNPGNLRAFMFNYYLSTSFKQLRICHFQFSTAGNHNSIIKQYHVNLNKYS